MNYPTVVAGIKSTIIIYETGEMVVCGKHCFTQSTHYPHDNLSIDTQHRIHLKYNPEIISITERDNDLYFIDKVGMLWCDYSLGKLSLPNFTSEKSKTGQFIALSMGEFHYSRLNKNGRVSTITFAGGAKALLKIPTKFRKNSEKFVQISAGKMHTLGLTKTGEVIAWGTNNTYHKPKRTYCGQCDVPYAVKNEKMIKVSAYGDGSVALSKSGDVYVWGDFGRYSVVGSPRCVFPKKGAAIDITCGKDYIAILLDNNKTIMVVGNNIFVKTKTYNMERKIINLYGGKNHVVALCENGSLLAIGDNSYKQCNIEDLKEIKNAYIYQGEFGGII